MVALSGELTQNERTHALQALRDRRARVCVATDVAARGIDIPDLELVIHAELPTGAESLQHRSGRTGRAGKKGISAILVPHPRRRRAEALMRTANINPTWMAPPSADDIRARDQERLIEQLRPTDEAAEEDLAIARALLEGGEAEQIVASLVRATRAAMPAPEDLVDNEPEPQSGFAARPAARTGFEDTVWYRIDIGRNKNAEARWLLPMICRRGHLTKSDIGAIRVFDRETRFEILREAAERFNAALAKAEDDGIHIELLAEPDLPAPRDRGPRKPSGPRPGAERRQHDGERTEKPWKNKPRPASAHPREGGDPAETHAGERIEKPWKSKPEGGDERVEKPWKAKPESHAERGPRPERAPKPYGPKPERGPKPDFAPRADAGSKPQTSKKQSAKLGGPKPFKPGKKPNGKSRWDA